MAIRSPNGDHPPRGGSVVEQAGAAEGVRECGVGGAAAGAGAARRPATTTAALTAALTTALTTALAAALTATTAGLAGLAGAAGLPALRAATALGAAGRAGAAATSGTALRPPRRLAVTAHGDLVVEPQGQRDALARHVDLQHLDLDDVART